MTEYRRLVVINTRSIFIGRTGKRPRRYDFTQARRDRIVCVCEKYKRKPIYDIPGFYRFPTGYKGPDETIYDITGKRIDHDQ